MRRVFLCASNKNAYKEKNNILCKNKKSFGHIRKLKNVACHVHYRMYRSQNSSIGWELQSTPMKRLHDDREKAIFCFQPTNIYVKKKK